MKLIDSLVEAILQAPFVVHPRIKGCDEPAQLPTTLRAQKQLFHYYNVHQGATI
jgi:hypothetical protein